MPSKYQPIQTENRFINQQKTTIPCGYSTTKCTKNQGLSSSNPLHLPKKKGNKHLSPTNSLPLLQSLDLHQKELRHQQKLSFFGSSPLRFRFAHTLKPIRAKEKNNNTNRQQQQQKTAPRFGTETKEVNTRELRRLTSPRRAAGEIRATGWRRPPASRRPARAARRPPSNLRGTGHEESGYTRVTVTSPQKNERKCGDRPLGGAVGAGRAARAVAHRSRPDL